jgi:hypothetical protein
MFFGSYLVREKILSYSDFLECISEQVLSAEPLVKIVSESEKLSEDKLLELIDKQVQSKKSLKEVILDDGILSNDDLIGLMKGSYEKQESFSDVMVRLNKLPKVEIESHLESFEKASVSTKVDTPAVEEIEISSAALESLRELEGIDLSDSGLDVISESSDKSEDKSDGGISSAALESLSELDPDAAKKLSDSVIEKTPVSVSSPTDTFVEEFGNTLSENMYSKMKRIVDIIFKTAEEEGDFSNFFNSLFREVHIVKGAARLASFHHVEDVLEMFENSIDEFFKFSDDLKKEWLTKHGSKLNQVIEELWKVRNSLVESKAEDGAGLTSLREVIDSLEL